jgi:hypothetical protein
MVIPHLLSAQFFYNETCRYSTGQFNLYGNAVGYTAGFTTNPDPEGDGWLRLVDNQSYQNGYVLLDETFPSSMGVSIEFDFKVWSSQYTSFGAADGFCVFLFNGDPMQPFSIGAAGASLGYYNLQPAYLGIGIDEYGNFSLSSLSHISGGPGIRPNAVVIANAVYQYVAGTAANLGSLNLSLSYPTNSPSRPADAVYYRRIKIDIDPANNGGMAVTVSIRKNSNEDFINVIGPVNVAQIPPPLLRLGYNASTGAGYCFHEVRDVIIRTPGALSVYKSIGNPIYNSSQPTVITTTVVKDGYNMNCNGTAVNDTLPALFTVNNSSITGGTFDTPPAVTTLMDGRTVYAYTVNWNQNEEYIYVVWEGSINGFPADGQLCSSVGIVPPSGFNDNNDTDNYACAREPVIYNSAFVANDDYASTGMNTPLLINVLENDSAPATCTPQQITTGQPAHGIAATVNDTTLRYTPATGWYGIDSLRYTVEDCNHATDSAMVYLLTHRPLAQTYIACADATVTMGFAPIAGVQYNWYNAPAGGALITSAATLSVVKNSGADIGTWWVEATYNGIAFPRIRVELVASDNCGTTTPTGCAVSGTLLFKEDFGGNSPSDPDIRPTGIPQVIGYTYNPDTRGAGRYSIRKEGQYHGSVWVVVDDHTHPDDITRGYFMQVDGSTDPTGQFYKLQVDGLCTDATLYFSMWAASLAPNYSAGNLSIVIEDTSGTQLSRFDTGDIPYASGANDWSLFGMTFSIPPGLPSVVFRIINNNHNSMGNDFALDDIEVRFCTPPVTIVSPTADEVCISSGLVLAGSYTDDGTFGDNLVYQWLYSTSGDINTPADWTAVPGASGSVADGDLSAAETACTPVDMGADSVRYFRLVVANAENIGNANCRAMSNIITVSRCSELHHDAASTLMNQPVVVDILANDRLQCDLTGVAVSASLPPAHGVAVLQSDTTLRYTPATGWYGIDSLRYTVEDCNHATDSAMVYLLTHRPLSQTYIACAGATVTMGFAPIAGVQYRWYPAPIGGALITSAATLSVVKNSGTDIGVWWVEAVYNGIVFPRIRIELEASDNCGTTAPTGCAVSGTLLFKEDFGGNSDSDPQDGPALPTSVISYNYKPTGTPDDGEYVITKQARALGTWYAPYDHTHAGVNRGYLLQVNAGMTPGQFYRYRIDDLCSGYRLYFSTWIMSLCNVAHPSKTNHLFILEDTDGNVLAQYYTGNVPDADSNWKNYGFEFTVPAGRSSIILKIINNGPGGNGNDFVMDDIEIRFCAPPIAVASPAAAEVCYTSGLALAGSYTDNGTFGNELVYQWEYSLTGDINTPADWSVVPGANGSSTNGALSALETAYTPVDMGADNVRYFRLLIANAENIGTANCRAMSQVIAVTVCLQLVRDTVATMWNQPVTADILANDVMQCDRDDLTGVAISTALPPAHGVAVILPADQSLLYTPDPDWYGIDSLRYTVEDCNHQWDSTTVYFYVAVQTTLYDTICQHQPYTGNGFSLPNQPAAGTQEFRRELTNTRGTDSTVVLHLCVHPAYADTVAAAICLHDSYYDHGFDLTPTVAGRADYSQHHTTAHHCDSSIYLQLTVHPSYDEVIYARIYEEEAYDFENESYHTPGQYTVTLPTRQGCDSVRTLHLTVIYYPPELTAFSPFNHDGVNDYLYPGYKIQVFNRYGTLLYESKTEEQIAMGWNGCNNRGQEVEPGMYFYILYTPAGSPRIKSTVEVLKRK